MNIVLATAAGLAAAVFASISASADSLPWTPPAGVEQVSPCVPKMDQHWADRKTLPLGPYYNVHDGKLIAIEYAVSAADLSAGKNWLDLPLTYAGKPLVLDHFDITFQAHGHKGFEAPHYDIHISPRTRRTPSPASSRQAATAGCRSTSTSTSTVPGLSGGGSHRPARRAGGRLISEGSDPAAESAPCVTRGRTTQGPAAAAERAGCVRAAA